MIFVAAHDAAFRGPEGQLEIGEQQMASELEAVVGEGKERLDLDRPNAIAVITRGSNAIAASRAGWTTA
jgi:hypothetical protein